MKASPLRIPGLWLLLALAFAAPAQARPPAPAPAPEAQIRATVARWYDELAKKDEGRLWGLTAPGFIDASPHYRYPPSRSRKLGRPYYTSLAATALKFAWEIDSIRSDAAFAKVRVWERGYFYAGAAKQTYELAASTIFILERSAEDGTWRILAHRSDSTGIPPNKVTDPMPDLSGTPAPPATP